jgi:hypothetical protein
MVLCFKPSTIFPFIYITIYKTTENMGVVRNKVSGGQLSRQAFNPSHLLSYQLAMLGAGEGQLI